jgi:hypothetical protein
MDTLLAQESFASQRETRAEAYKRIEAILEKAGTAGVHRAYFLYALRWSQSGARISEMNDLGWSIESVTLPKGEWAHGIRTKYILRSKPLEVAPGEDWYQKLKGRPRPGWQARPFSDRRMSDPDCFRLTAPVFGTSTAP